MYTFGKIFYNWDKGRKGLCIAKLILYISGLRNSLINSTGDMLLFKCYILLEFWDF